MKALVLAISVLVSAASSEATSAATPQQIAEAAFRSVVLIVMQDADGRPLALGSGFCVEQDVVASNFHVLEGATSGYARLVGTSEKVTISGIIGIDHLNDLVLLRVDGLRAPPLSLNEGGKVAVADPVYCVGNPRGLEGTFSAGIISAIREVGVSKLLQLTAPISPGSSGGPVLDSAGRVIGIAFASFSGGQNLNFAIPTSHLQKLLQTKEPLKSLGAARATRSVTSILAELGDSPLEGAELGSFLWSSSFMPDGKFTLSIRNKLRQAIRDVSALVIFSDIDGKALDSVELRFDGAIGGGLAKRAAGTSDPSVQRIILSVARRLELPRMGTSAVLPNSFASLANLIRFRILSFELTE